ncbi:hypothetical protein H4R34_003399 [Dimargaris verticillata]|uniref:Midasin n=1 Tax=Dimargaris verticillata TaxID=2761393 RepID=A0A9W8E935_9FUNG|nr:hypothetical protein H4R34_003399 [Dimargaris verticillata]
MQISTVYLAAFMAATASIGVLARPVGYATTHPAYPTATPAYQAAAPVDCMDAEGSYTEVVEPEVESCDDAAEQDSDYAGEAPAAEEPVDNADAGAGEGGYVANNDQGEEYGRSNGYTDWSGDDAAPESTPAYSETDSSYSVTEGEGDYTGNDHSGEQDSGDEGSNGYGDDAAPESTPAYTGAGDDYPLETPTTSGPQEGGDTDGNYGSEQPAEDYLDHELKGHYDTCEDVDSVDEGDYTARDAPEHDDGEHTDDTAAEPSGDNVSNGYHAEAPDTGYSAQPAEAQPEQSGGYKIEAY